MKHSTPEALPPPPPVVPSGLVPAKVSHALMDRHGFGTKGQKISLVTNHFNVKLSSTSDHFYQYSVSTLLLYAQLYITIVQIILHVCFSVKQVKIEHHRQTHAHCAKN